MSAAGKLVTIRNALTAMTVVLVGYLALVALSPGLPDHMPAALNWFGQPGPHSWQTLAVMTVVLVPWVVLQLQSRSVSSNPGRPVQTVGGLLAITLVMGLSSFWNCSDSENPRFFTAVLKTASLVKGMAVDGQLKNGGCLADPPPVAIALAHLTGQAAIFITVLGAAAAVFRTRWDWIRVRLASRVTAIVDLNADAVALVGHVAAMSRLEPNRSTPVAIVETAERVDVQEARTRGARLIVAPLSQAKSLVALSIWRKVQRLYLLSPDPATNLARLVEITDQLSATDRHRIPLIVRIDDPWQAQVWRARHFADVDHRWAADTVGLYEGTARGLLDRIGVDDHTERIVICGASPLTFALMAELARRAPGHDYRRKYIDPELLPQPSVILVAPEAGQYRSDHKFARRQFGFSPEIPEITAAYAERPTVGKMLTVINAGTPARTAVVFVDGSAPRVDAAIATSLAARFPDTAVYLWDRDAKRVDDEVTVMGKLRTYRLSMDLPDGQAHDTWDRAAQLIHERYVAEATVLTPATLPWHELSEFYRESNRRQVENALRIVEDVGGHTWSTWGMDPDAYSADELLRGAPLDRLRLIGFDGEAAYEMARAEHENWCEFLRRHGWKHGPREDQRRRHDKLVPWSAVATNPELLNGALKNLANTLTTLRELGFRSRPAGDAAASPPEAAESWQLFTRVGTIEAEQRGEAWTWTTTNGATMDAQAGDWSVSDTDGRSWSVRDGIFQAQHQHVEGNRWKRNGAVEARPAHDGETIETLEGPVTAASGDWVVKGERGELWPVPAEEFTRRYKSSVESAV